MVKFLEGPSVRDLAWYLAEQLAPPPEGADRNGHHKANGKPADPLGHLSDAEVDAMLRDLLAAERKE